MNGWIKMHRSIKSHWVFKDPEKFKAWAYILMTVNYERGTVFINGKKYICERGESLKSLDTWAKDFGGKYWNKSRVRRFFDALRKDNMITTKSEGNTTRLVVCNYEKYQDDEKMDGKKWHAHDTETDTPDVTQLARTTDTLSDDNKSDRHSNGTANDTVMAHRPTPIKEERNKEDINILPSTPSTEEADGKLNESEKPEQSLKIKKEKKRKVPAKEKKEYSEDDRRVARWFYNQLNEKQKKRVKREDQENWLDTVEKCYRLDGYSHDRILEICKYAKSSQMWSVNFQSLCKLRKVAKGYKSSYIERWEEEMDQYSNPAPAPKANNQRKKESSYD